MKDRGYENVSLKVYPGRRQGTEGACVAGPWVLCCRSQTYPSLVPDFSVAGPEMARGPGTVFVVLCVLASQVSHKNADQGRIS